MVGDTNGKNLIKMKILFNVDKLSDGKIKEKYKQLKLYAYNVSIKLIVNN